MTKPFIRLRGESNGAPAPDECHERSCVLRRLSQRKETGGQIADRKFNDFGEVFRTVVLSCQPDPPQNLPQDAPAAVRIQRHRFIVPAVGHKKFGAIETL